MRIEFTLTQSNYLFYIDTYSNYLFYIDTYSNYLF